MITLELSIRALDPVVRDLIEARIRTLCVAQADAFGCQADVLYERGYPVLVNSPAETRLAQDVAEHLAGGGQVNGNAEPLQASEDFAFMLERVPGAYIMVGNGDNGHSDGKPVGPCSVHNPQYDFNDACLRFGAGFFVALAERFFSSGACR